MEEWRWLLGVIEIYYLLNSGYISTKYILLFSKKDLKQIVNVFG